MPDLSYSPWTEEEVENLNEYQQSDVFHPFTCTCGRSLIATCDGWVCEECDYTQNWAHEFMADGSFKKFDNYRFLKGFNNSDKASRISDKELSQWLLDKAKVAFHNFEPIEEVALLEEAASRLYNREGK